MQVVGGGLLPISFLSWCLGGVNYFHESACESEILITDTPVKLLLTPVNPAEALEAWYPSGQDKTNQVVDIVTSIVSIPREKEAYSGAQ